MVCANCGNELMEGAKFCSNCGSKVIPERHCPMCGAKLPNWALFCHECGADVREQESAGTVAPKGKEIDQVADMHKTVSQERKTVPDMLGFYGCYKSLVSANDEAAIFYDTNDDICRYEQNGKLVKKHLDISVSKMVQVADGILCTGFIDMEQSGKEYEKLVLYKLDKDFNLLSQKTLKKERKIPKRTDEMTADLLPRSFYTMNDRYAFYGKWKSRGYLSNDEKAYNMELSCFDLESGEEKKASYKAPMIDGCNLIMNQSGSHFILCDGRKVYFDAKLVYQDEDGNQKGDIASVIYDFNLEDFSILWKPRRGKQDSDWRDWEGGRPYFFDFAKEIMWTTIRREEMEQRGLTGKVNNFLVARKIAPDAPILYPDQIWGSIENIDDIIYFDGIHAYSRTSENQFYAVDRFGTCSEKWNPNWEFEFDGFWPQRDWMFLGAMETQYICPMTFSKPSGSEIQKVKKAEIKMDGSDYEEKNFSEDNRSRMLTAELDDSAFHSEYYPHDSSPGRPGIGNIASNNQWLVYHNSDAVIGNHNWYKMRTDGSCRQEIMVGRQCGDRLLGFNRYGIWTTNDIKKNIFLRDEDGEIIRHVLIPEDLDWESWRCSIYIYGDTVMVYSGEKVYMIAPDNKASVLYQAHVREEYIREESLSFNNEFLTFQLMANGPGFCVSPSEWVLYNRKTNNSLRLGRKRTAEGDVETEIYSIFLDQNRMWTAPTKQEYQKHGYANGKVMVEREIGEPVDKVGLRVWKGVAQGDWANSICCFDGEDAYLGFDENKLRRVSLDGTSAKLDADRHKWRGYVCFPLLSKDALFVNYDGSGAVRLPRRFSSSSVGAADNLEAEDVFRGTLE